MSMRDHRITLRQIEEYAGRAQEICAGKTLDELVADWQATMALERALEVLGEAPTTFAAGIVLKKTAAAC